MQSARKVSLSLLATSLLTAISNATAQQSHSPAPAAQVEPVSVTPQRTTATYASWVLECESQPGPPPQKVCDIAQGTQTQVQGRTIPVTRVALMRQVKNQPLKLVVQVPVSITFSTNVRVQTADSEPGINAPFARCSPSGCFADFDIKDEVLKKFRAASGNGKISFADSTGNEIAVPLSFSGFNQAVEALLKE
jgi:invasion protein IalB